MSVTGSSSLTYFSRVVYALTRLIPAGKVISYGRLAHYVSQTMDRLGVRTLPDCDSNVSSATKSRKTSSLLSRAVGNALRRNPYAPWVPCHRIVASDQSIGGYSGAKASDSKEIQRKIRVLRLEGVETVFDSKKGKYFLKDSESLTEVLPKEWLSLVKSDLNDSALKEENANKINLKNEVIQIVLNAYKEKEKESADQHKIAAMDDN